MKSSTLRLQIALTLLLSVAVLWGFTFFVIHRAEQQEIAKADLRARSNAHAFAEHALSTIKRIDSTLKQLAFTWVAHPADFRRDLHRIEETISDISIQVSVTNHRGFLVYSNLGDVPPEKRDFSDREHVRVHFASTEDRLYISKPVLGRISGKWSIQFTRPIFRQGQFDGVIILSISPDVFSQFYKTLSLGAHDVATMVRDTGEVMARTPDWEKFIGQIISGSPYLLNDAPTVGSYRRGSVMDSVDRLYGYYRLPDYHLTLVSGSALDDALESAKSQRQAAVGIALVVTAFLLAMAWIIHRTLQIREAAEAKSQFLNIRLEERVAERTAELEAANRELEAFTFATSHDLKGPLGRINSFSTLLEQQYRDKLEGHGLLYLEFIRQNSTRLTDLVDDLLCHARIAQQALELKPVDVLTRVLLVVEECAEDIREAHADVRVNVPPVRVLADPQALTQALSNLVQNALKYSAASKPPVIEIGAEERGAYLHLWVRDNGIGFDMAYHDKIFEIFSRLHTYNEFAGSGVGLALVKRAMERMGGRVWAESKPEQGATFFLNLELCAEQVTV